MSAPLPARATTAFRWNGRDRQGHAQSGQIQALNADLARVQLRRQGLQQVQLQRLWWSTPNTVKAKDLAVMTRQWAAMLRAGVPVVQALGMLCRSMSAKGLVLVMNNVRSDVEAGVALHDALAKHPKHFSGLYVHMVQAGEAAGILDTMMERLSLTLEKNEAMRKTPLWGRRKRIGRGFNVCQRTYTKPMGKDCRYSKGTQMREIAEQKNGAFYVKKYCDLGVWTRACVLRIRMS